MSVSAIDAALQAGLAGVGVVQPAHHQAVEPVDRPAAAVRNQPDFLDVAGLEPHRRSAGQVEPHAVGLLAVEDEGPVGLEEVVVGADLHGPVARVVDGESDDRQARVKLEVRPIEEIFAGNHASASAGVRGEQEDGAFRQWIGSWIVTSLRAVGEGRLDLDHGDHLRHALHDVGAAEDFAAGAHDLGDGSCRRGPFRGARP